MVLSFSWWPSIALLVITILSISPEPHYSTTSSSSSSSSLVVEATKVIWQGNDNVPPPHEAAHNAPRSQKYWDEHGIERPEYAMTDAEIRAKRRQQGSDAGNDGRGGRLSGLVGIFLVVPAVLVLLAIVYAYISGDWDTILNNPVGSIAADCIRWMMERAGYSGHRLGSSSTTIIGAAASRSKGLGDEDSRRLARLARFDNPKNMLDDMKTD
jgi:hypothetical protein